MKTRLSATSATLASWPFGILGILAFCAGTNLGSAADTQPTLHKTGSAFYPPELVARAKENIAKYPWAAAMQKRLVEAAKPWMAMSDDDLWSLMFGNTIKRSWMVWSSGYCPACKQGVPMYNWQVDALKQPWKIRCPHCKEYFPKNDFAEFYRSGMDEHGIFDPGRADRSLLFNTEHPDPKDPLHKFGVDDGEGYAEGSIRWRFIGAYLIYGQWKQAVVRGITALSDAYVVTGDPAYAHKAGILLDRVADLYPTFDFIKQGIIYDAPSSSAGYVSVWHDACEETRNMVLSYDKVFAAIRKDRKLPAFLARKAKQFKLGVPKGSFGDIQRNIEGRILRDSLANRAKITTNYPRTEIAAFVIETVLGGPGSRERADAILQAMMTKATAVDGVTGEKGLAGYTAFTIRGVAELLEQCARLDPDFLKTLIERCPRLRETYRFHIDTWCLGTYYPASGDTTAFAQPARQYAGVGFTRAPDLTASMYSFLWHLYKATGDPAYVQVLYHANGGTTEGLPHDLFAENPAAIQDRVRDVIAREGPTLTLGSVDKQQWHLAILRSGAANEARATWLDYDAGGNHSHADGMNLGLFAKGLDLMPDFGYPPVQYGGWSAPRAVWYTMTAAHNTVVVDGRNQSRTAGTTTLWADGREFRAIRASAPALINGKQYERTVAMVDTSDRGFYLFDVFRVVGGTDHAKFTHSHFGRIATEGLSLAPSEDFGNGTQMRNFRHDPKPSPAWRVDWTIDDRQRLLPPGSDVHLRYTDLTNSAAAFTCEGWVSIRNYDGNSEAWIPRVMVRRRSDHAPLASTFVAVIEPYERASGIAAIRRLPLRTEEGEEYPDSNVAIEVRLADGRRDLLVAAEVENPLGLSPSRGDHRLVATADAPRPLSAKHQSPNPGSADEGTLQTDAELCRVRQDAAGNVTGIAMCRGTFVQMDRALVRLKKDTPYVEITFEDRKATMRSGDPSVVEEAEIDGRSVMPQ